MMWERLSRIFDLEGLSSMSCLVVIALIGCLLNENLFIEFGVCSDRMPKLRECAPTPAV